MDLKETLESYKSQLLKVNDERNKLIGALERANTIKLKLEGAIESISELVELEKKDNKEQPKPEPEPTPKEVVLN